MHKLTSSQKNGTIETLTYTFATNRREISTNPLNSDSIVNLAHMEHLVGTLVKEGPSGLEEPYLAKKWTSDAQGKIWRFEIRTNLVCEDGSVISAQSFVASLTNSLRLYQREKGFLPVFSQLKGFAELKSKPKGNVDGLRAENNSVVFEFNDSVQTGLLEFLSMPYYGYYCSSNFKSDGRWKDPTKIISSGPYTLDELNNELGTVKLKRRDDWFSTSSGSPKNVTIRQDPIDHAYKKKEFSIYATLQPDFGESIQGFKKVKLVPEVLTSIVLCPRKRGLFFEEKNRKYFRSKLIQDSLHWPQEEVGHNISNWFFPNLTSNLPDFPAKSSITTSANNIISVLVFDTLSDKQRKLLYDSITKIVKSLSPNITVKFELLDRTDKDWVKKATSNELYDLRIATVSAGGSYINWVVEMMFCSKMGISFPDPSGRICDLVKRAKSLGLNSNESGAEFNQILAEDAAVLPLWHSGFTWFVSEDLTTHVLPTLGVPRFDLIRAKE